MGKRYLDSDNGFGASIARFKRKAVRLVLSPWRLFKTLCFGIGFSVVLGCFGVSLYFYSFWRSLPNLEKMTFHGFKASAEKRVGERRENKHKHLHWVDLKQVNRDFLFAIVMSEDALFFEHDGIDFDAMMNAAAYNVIKRSYEYGASTLSQQVVKNVFLTHEKTIVRKLKEVFITRALERRFSKNEILEVYLNTAEFGPDLYGAQEASVHYFGKAPLKVNAAEGAFIALMLPSPRRNHYSIFENKNITNVRKKKIRRILGDMLANEYISAEQYRKYVRYDFFKSQHGRGVANSHE